MVLDIFFSLWKKNILQFLKKTLQKICTIKKVALYLFPLSQRYSYKVAAHNNRYSSLIIGKKQLLRCMVAKFY